MIAQLLILIAMLLTGMLPALAGPGRYRAVDGDTVRIGPNLVRLKGFDTPESVPGQYRCDRELVHGKKAGKRLQELLDLGPVRIVRDGKKDKYGRVLAVLFIGHENVSDILIREGLAVPYTGRVRRSINFDWCRHL